MERMPGLREELCGGVSKCLTRSIMISLSSVPSSETEFGSGRTSLSKAEKSSVV